MGLIERIYQPLAKDVISGLNQRRRVYTWTGSTAATTVGANTSATPILPGIAFFVTGWSCSMTPGAAQRFLYGQLILRDENANVIVRFAGLRTLGTVIGAAVQERQADVVDLVALPGDSFEATTVFDAGGAANSFLAYVWGYEVPRGNIER